MRDGPGPAVHPTLRLGRHLRTCNLVGEPKALPRVMARVPSQGTLDGITLKLMGALQQVLVVDDGHRAIDHSLAAELAELGYASVTASLEAAEDVLAVI